MQTKKHPNKIKKRPTISIVIPAYNEELRLPNSIIELKQYLDKNISNYEVLIIVEKSKDNSLQVALNAINNDSRFTVIDNKVHRGKGYAVKTGILKSRGNVVFFMDADLSTHLSSIEDFLQYFKKNPKTDVIIGSREHPKSDIQISQNVIRRHLGKVFNRFVQLLILPGYKDTQCGFKAFKNSVAKVLFKSVTTDGFAFDTEVLLLAKKYGFRVVEQPVIWSNSNTSQVHIIFSPIKMLIETIKIRIKYSRIR